MDVSAIAEKMIDDRNERHHCTVAGLKDSLMTRMESYKWPGNVRELRNTIERAVDSGWVGDARRGASAAALWGAGVCSSTDQAPRCGWTECTDDTAERSGAVCG